MGLKKEALRIGIEQGRATIAYQYAQDGAKLEKRQEYKAYTKKIPLLIKNHGLGAALAFIKAKADSDKAKSGYAYYLIYQQIDQWLNNETNKYLLSEIPPGDLVGRVVQLNSTEYRLVTVEVLALLFWVRRFSEGLIKGEAKDG